MKKLAIALILCLAVFGPAPWADTAPSTPVAVVMPDAGSALLNPLDTGGECYVFPTIVAESNLNMRLGRISERTITPDANLRLGGANKLAHEYQRVLGSPLLC